MASKDHKPIYEFSGSQNLNTTPLDVTGLDGDKWDYIVEWECLPNSSTLNGWQIGINNDTGSNYREYEMLGTSSTAGAYVYDTATSIDFGQGCNTTTPFIFRAKITGDSSGERYIDTLLGEEIDYLSIGKRLRKGSYYWKNTVDNLTSLQFKATTNVTNADITLRIYQVPKQANLDNYDLVEVVEFANRSTDIVFSGLDGDADGEYLIEGFSDTVVGRLRINGDSGSNYVVQRLSNTIGTIGANNSTQTDYDCDGNNFQFKINSTTGRKRLITGGRGKTSSDEQRELAGWWSNTVDNITSLTIHSLSNATGTIKLYRRKSNRTIDPIPMRTVVEHDISGVDFSAGITISGIEGDRIDGPIKVEYEEYGDTANNSTLEIQYNGDTTANYNIQSLYGDGATAGAGNITVNYNSLGIFDDAGKTELWLYPKSGQNRPSISRSHTHFVGGYQVNFRGQWWNNSVDEITSIKIYTLSSNLHNGKIRISVPKNTKQASPSFTVTVN